MAAKKAPVKKAPGKPAAPVKRAAGTSKSLPPFMGGPPGMGGATMQPGQKKPATTRKGK